MKQYAGYLIDLDGTMYRGKERIEEAVHFVNMLKQKDVPYLFVTNNSSRTPEQVAAKLISMEIPATTEQVFTSSMATANFIAAENNHASVYFIGEEGLEYALKQAGLTVVDENPDYVVMGIDREITYEKLAKGCLYIRAGAKYIATNSDIAIPTERGFLPGNGALSSVLTVSTGVQPLLIGKPEAIIMELALNTLGTTKEETLMIGDNYNTDILAGIHAGIDTLLVHTGVTTKEHLKTYEIQPTYVINSLEEWLDKI
ncbi:TIGR01457 family HAD-type hydrolase [Bacillus sp. Marseille-P3661]|uniref:TIGR01457 family HAD-type hydrolase n=1 Tax=Bacillus sp. Marseille-P3661 TaxID=1936234 RepID=UPI000C83D0F0|nr:TIGR01457 family HAD-type hydrolase [Bacillus sp. Marseille-P3661]